MALPDTVACGLSAGRRMIGKESASQAFIERMNKVDAIFCDVVSRTNIERSILFDCCPLYESYPSSSSSSSSGCMLDEVVVAQDVIYQISEADLTQDAYDALELLELEACALLRSIKYLELLNETCPSSSSSSSSSSTTTP